MLTTTIIYICVFYVFGFFMFLSMLIALIYVKYVNISRLPFPVACVTVARKVSGCLSGVKER